MSSILSLNILTNLILVKSVIGWVAQFLVKVIVVSGVNEVGEIWLKSDWCNRV